MSQHGIDPVWEDIEERVTEEMFDIDLLKDREQLFIELSHKNRIAPG